MLFSFPLLKDGGKLMVRDDDMLINLCNAIDIIHHPAQNCILPNLQQWFRKVLCQFTQPCGIASRNNNTYHTFFFFEHG